jgi:hypothetical protein
MGDKIKIQMVLLSVLGILAGIGLGFVVLNVDPFQANMFQLVLFYAFFSILVFCFSTLAFLVVRRGFIQIQHSTLGVAAREGFFLTVLLSGSLYLSSQQILSTWILLTFAVTIILLELFFLT